MLNKIKNFLCNLFFLKYESLRGCIVFVLLLFLLLFIKILYYEMLVNKIYTIALNFNKFL